MRKNILFALLANLVNAGFSWLMLILIIRLGTKEDIGMFGLAQAIALPIHMFFTLKLRTIQLSDVSKIYTDEEYFISRLYLSVLSLIFTILVACIFYFDKIDSIYAISALAISYSAAIIREYYISIYQIRERNDYLFFSNLIQGACSVFFFMLLFIVSGDFLYSILLYALIKFTFLLLDNKYYQKLSNYYISEFFKNTFNKNILSLFKSALPLGVVSVIGALFTSIPRLKLEEYWGLSELGVFTTLMSLVVFINLFTGSFIQAILPRMTNIYVESKKAFLKQLITSFVSVSIVLAIFLLICREFSFYILLTVFGGSYTSYENEFLLAMLSGCVLCYFHLSNFLLNVQREYSSQVYIYSLSAVASYISADYLIPRYGLDGAIYSTIICSLVGIVLSTIVFTKNFLKKV